MYTHLRRKLQQKHHFAYTEAGASARGDVYASAQKASAKTSFCVYRSWGVCEGQCVRICAESFSENIILRIQKLRRLRGELYTLLLRSFERKHVHWADNVYASTQESSAKTSFCVYRSRRVCEGRCIRFCAESFSENIILRIQKLRRLRGELYTLLLRSFERKHVHWADNVYASAQESSAKTSFCVYRC